MQKFMEKAYKQAYVAYRHNEVPVGAVIVKDGKIISRAYNTRNKSQDAIAHAEVLAISKACKKLKSWRLDGCDIYVTLEPCPMCAGAIRNARINNLYYGASDKTGDENLLKLILSDNRLNHKIKPNGGIMEQECSQLISDFFKTKRNK